MIRARRLIGMQEATDALRALAYEIRDDDSSRALHAQMVALIDAMLETQPSLG